MAGGGGGLGRASALDLARAGRGAGPGRRRRRRAGADRGRRPGPRRRGRSSPCSTCATPTPWRGCSTPATDRFGRLDILVNVVGGTFRSPFTDVSAKGRDALVRTNFTWVVDATQRAALAHGGRGPGREHRHHHLHRGPPGRAGLRRVRGHEGGGDPPHPHPGGRARGGGHPHQLRGTRLRPHRRPRRRGGPGRLGRTARRRGRRRHRPRRLAHHPPAPQGRGHRRRQLRALPGLGPVLLHHRHDAAPRRRRAGHVGLDGLARRRLHGPAPGVGARPARAPRGRDRTPGRRPRARRRRPVRPRRGDTSSPPSSPGGRGRPTPCTAAPWPRCWPAPSSRSRPTSPCTSPGSPSSSSGRCRRAVGTARGRARDGRLRAHDLLGHRHRLAPRLQRRRAGLLRVLRLGGIHLPRVRRSRRRGGHTLDRRSADVVAADPPRPGARSWSGTRTSTTSATSCAAPATHVRCPRPTPPTSRWCRCTSRHTTSRPRC